MTPSGVNPIFHISQYDVGRALGFIVHSGGATIDLDTYTCTVEATRSDGTAITSAVATTDNIGTFEVTPTMSNKADKYRCQLVIVDENSKRIASLPFDMEVTKAAMDENSESIEEDASLYQQYTEAVQGAIAETNADIQAEENARIAAVSAEATARANADTTLQNNIDAEATTRQTADNTLQGNINSEASARASADSNLQSQIDQIIAPSGEAPSAAEVQNARIGADGVTYDTLGNAIRGQVTDLKSAISGKLYDYYETINGIINGAGKLAYASIANFKYIPVSAGDYVKIKGNATNNTYYTLLKSAVVPAVGTSTDADFATGYTSRVGITLNASVELVVPSDAKYLYVTNYDNGGSGDKYNRPQSITINGAEVFDSIEGQIIKANDGLSKRVRFDESQIITDEQKKTARLNIGAARKEIEDAVTKSLFDYYEEYNGIINSSGKMIYTINAKCKFVPVSGGDKIVIKGNSTNMTYYSLVKTVVVPVVGETLDVEYATGYTGRNGVTLGGSVEITAPSDAKFIYVTTYDINGSGDKSKAPQSILVDGTEIFNSIIDQIKDVSAILNEYPLEDLLNDTPETKNVTNDLERGYINYQTGAFSSFGTDVYKATQIYIPIPGFAYKIILGCNLPASTGAGMAFYSAESESAFISGSQKMEFVYDEIPANAKYLRLTDYNANGSHSNITVTIYYGDIVNRLESVEQKTESVYIKKVACWGDSVTEGIGMPDQGTVVYGGDTYESHLYTMLKDADKPFIVENHGHRYERSIGVISRFKGAYLNDDVTIPANNTPVSLGSTYMENGRLIGTDKLDSYLGSDESVRFFVGAGFDTNPLNIGGADYTLVTTVTRDADNHAWVEMKISKTTPDGVQTILPKNTLVLTSSNRTADINVVYVGINDGNGISLQDWIDRNLQVQEANPKTIVIGCTHALWTGWQSMTGTPEQKYQTYLDAAHAQFGARFIDLYADLVSDKGMQIAIDAGYLSDRTPEQIEEDEANIANKIVPASLTENGVPGNVHLNSAGYYIFAKLVFDRLVALGWV
jgi:lysophospholipase L1-like esterase